MVTSFYIDFFFLKVGLVGDSGGGRMWQMVEVISGGGYSCLWWELILLGTDDIRIKTWNLSQAPQECFCKMLLVLVKCLAKHTLVLSAYKYWG